MASTTRQGSAPVCGAACEGDELAKRAARVAKTLARRGSFTEIMRKALEFCAVRRSFRETEEEMATYPEFRSMDQSQAAIIYLLVEAGGLALHELDEHGREVTPADKRGLSEDEVDALVCSFALETTAAGAAAIKDLRPEQRLARLFAQEPARADAYLAILELCRVPQSYERVAEAMAGRPPLESLNDLSGLPAYPSALLAKLEAAGGLVWDEGWTLTEAGCDHLRALAHAGEE